MHRCARDDGEPGLGAEKPVNGWRVEGFNEIRELGSGAQGRVVLAVPEGHDVQVAIKYLAPALLSDQSALAVFRREAETLARVSNPHVARLYQYVETPQGAAIVMEAVSGASLRSVLDNSGGPLSPEAALAVLKGSLLGLAAAHGVGVVHRDYKPANVVVQPDGTSKLIDFGVAALTGQSSRSGTPAYMAPEQWEGSPASPATDLYAAACVLYECLTGTKPYHGRSTAELMTQHLTAPIPLDSVPEPVRPLLARGLAKNPAERLWDAAGFAAELERVAVAAYGPDWERRGLHALAASAAALATAAPLAVLGSFAAESAAPAASATPAAPTAPSSPAAPGFREGAVGKAGFAAKRGGGVAKYLSGTKVIVGAAVVATAAATTAGAFVVRELREDGTTSARPSPAASPTPTTVGGRSTGQFRVGFSNPAPFRENQGPSMTYALTAEPARVKQGTRLTVSVKLDSRNPPIAHSWFLGSKASTTFYLAFYRVPPASEGTLPSTPGEQFVARMRETEKARTTSLPGGWRHFTVTTAYTATVPDAARLSPGRYLVSPFSPPVVGGVEIRNEPVSPASLGAWTQGSLPVVTVLPGTDPRATGSAPPSSSPSSRTPQACRTITRDDGAKIVRC